MGVGSHGITFHLVKEHFKVNIKYFICIFKAIFPLFLPFLHISCRCRLLSMLLVDILNNSCLFTDGHLFQLLYAKTDRHACFDF